MKEKREKGSIMVEAAIYFPLVLCSVMALLYLALFNMQEFMMLYEAERVAYVASRETAYPGYSKFNMGQNNEIDFNWGSGSVPSSSQIDSYYKAYHSGASNLYREVGGILRGIGALSADSGSYSARFADAARQSTLIALGTISAPEVDIDSGFFGSGITVTITHSIKMPGVLAYLGYDGTRTIRASAYNYSVNPSSFVRNVDLAADMVNYIFEKLGISGGFNTFISKVNTVLDKIL